MNEHTTLLDELETVELDKADQIALKEILHATSWNEEDLSLIHI